jgi:ankyrin repeat protein
VSMDEMAEAVKCGDVARVQALLGADPGLAAEKDEAGVSLILLALYHRQPETAEALAEAKGELDVFEAAGLGRAAQLIAALQGDPTLTRSRSADGFTALHLACFFGQPECARALVEAGADVNVAAENPSRVRPLHSAVAARQRPIAELLLGRGAEVDPQQRGGYTALHSAAMHGDEALVDLLLAHGANPRLAAEDGKDAMGFAREGGFSELAGRLVAAGPAADH